MLVLSLFIAIACFQAVFAEYVRMEPSVNTFSSKLWRHERTLGDDEIVKAVFALKHDPAAVQAFEKNFFEISTPSHPRYGQFMTQEEIARRLSPSADKVKIVTDFLNNHGVAAENIVINKYRDMINVEMPAKIANKMFQTEFGLFRSVAKRNVVLPRITRPYYLPEEVAEVVSIVDDIMRFPSVRSVIPVLEDAQTTGTDAEFNSCNTGSVKCQGTTTPAVLKKAYNIPTLTSVAPGNSMSVAEFQYQYYDNTDLKSFSNACGATVTVDTTVGGNNESICLAGGCVEALLDIEYIEAVANPIPLTVIYLAQFSLLNWANQVNTMANPPLVHSVSYGNDEVQQTSVDYMNSVNVEFQKSGALGLSVLFASGDQGVWGRTGVGATYHPDFPAASPYVTAVGGTDFSTKSVIGPESVWPCGGGGFSDTFTAPAYQQAAVSAYLANAAAAGVLPPANLFNATGRGYPDVAALGGQVNPYCVGYHGGSFGGVSGTSASCPVVAGIFAQLNNVRLAAGKSSLGFLNPLIYSNPQCFNDVLDGSQNNCNAGTTGFAAIKGWDAATGFGSPNYNCLAGVV